MSSFRPATIEDAPLLYRWRREREQGPWWKGTPVSYHQHQHWLEQRLACELVRVLIWEDDGEPLGTLRIDSNGEVAFYAESDDVALEMLLATRVYASEYGGRLKATVDEADPGWEMLAWAGFAEHPTRFLCLKP